MAAFFKTHGATLLKIAVSAVLLALLLAFADLEKVGAAFASFSWPWLVPALGLIAASVAVSALKWGWLLRAQGLSDRFGTLFGAYTAGLFFNNFLPSSLGGDGVRILLLGRETGRQAAVAASVVAERALATVSLALVGLGASLFVPGVEPLIRLAFGLILAAGLLVSAVILGGWVPGWLRRRPGRFAQAVVAFAEGGADIRRRPGLVWASLSGAAVFQILVAGVNAAVALGLGLEIPFVDLVFVVSAASVLAMVPLGLNGYGLREGGYIALLAPYGIEAGSALALSVLFALFVSLYSLGGLGVWLRRRPPKEAPDLGPQGAPLSEAAL